MRLFGVIFQHCLLASNCKTNTRFSSLSRGSQLLVRLLLLLTPNSQTNWVLDIKSQLYLVWISLQSIKSKKWRGRQHLTSNPIWSGLSSSLQAPAKLQKGKNAFSFYLFSHWKMRHSHLFTPFFSSGSAAVSALAHSLVSSISQQKKERRRRRRGSSRNAFPFALYWISRNSHRWK